MNQNRNNNRRRGRGNNRGQGGGNQGNRIDNRARGNAPQMLEKYRKLAHDASLNGDRVQTEYYLQFADHYFRVIADNRAQKDDGRPQRQGGEREAAQDFEYEYEDGEADFGRNRPYQTRREREEEEEAAQDSEAAGESEAPDNDEPNPFLREGRSRRSRGRSRGPQGGDGDGEGEDGNGFDPQVLPPSIARNDEGEEPAPEAARPRRTRRPRPADEGDSEPLEAVG